MKKILTLLLVIILAAIFIGPKIVGSQFSDGIQNAVNAINENPNYTASLKSIDSGWSSTTAEVLVGINMTSVTGIPGAEASDLSITLNVTGVHGPIILSDKFAIGWLYTVVQTQSIEIPQGLVLPNNDAFYKFEGVTGLFGTTHYEDHIAQMLYTDAEAQSTMNFSGLTGKGSFSSSGVKYDSLIESMSMDVANMLNFDMQNIAINFDSPESIGVILSQGLYDSSIEIATQLISFADITKGTEVLVNNTQIIGTSEYDKQSDLGNLSMTTTVESVDAPNMALSDLKSVININNIQAKFLLAYQEFSSKMLDNMSDQAQVKADLDAFMDTYLLAQLKAKPEYNFSDISGKINGSEFSANILATVGEVTELPKALEDTAFWMQNIIVNSNMMFEKDAANHIANIMVSRQLLANPNFAALDKAQQTQIVAQQVQGTIDGLLQQGMVTLEGEKYTMAFTLQDGVAVLNGNTIPL